MSNRNYGQGTDGSNPDETFAPDNPGKPKGCRHRATNTIEELLQGSSEPLTQKAVDTALASPTK